MKVSVVTPSYNQGVFIERTIQSVFSQDWEPVEYVVFDGGSSDNTVEVLKKYGDRLRWVSARDGGQGDAVNKGLGATSGDLIGWLNSDDVYYPGAIRAAAEYLSAHPEVGVIYGMADHIGVDDVPFEPYPTEPWNFEKLQDACFICQPAAFFRRSVVEKYGSLDSNLHYCMDYEYWLRLGAAGVRFGYLERKLAGSRMYAENKTRSSVVKVHAEINDMLKKKFGRVPDRWLTNYAHTIVNPRVDRVQHPRRFVIEIVSRSMLAALRWNRRISPQMKSTMFDLLKHHFRRS
jgi:glycosyltransferase involved in cell wall biosynthesis